jgi:hypothetical protein
VGTNKFVDFIPILENGKRRHLGPSQQFVSTKGAKGGATYSTNADFLRDLILLVHIDLIELNRVNPFGQLLKDGRDDSARATPRSPEVNDDDFARVDLIVPCRSIIGM